jgi:NTE family protein
MAAKKEDKPRHPPCTGLVLPGGGARGAYQAGVLKAIAGFVPPDTNPFPIVTGTSVGAINATVIASHAGNFTHGATRLAEMWSQLHADQVYRTDFRAVAGNGMRWLASLVFGGLGIANPKSLLDNEPLRELLGRTLDFSRIDEAIAQGALRAMGLTASSYDRGKAITFYQGAGDVAQWTRMRREGVRHDIGVDHVMASASLPFMFPAERIGNEHFGDGSLRLTSPLSPAIHLGAERILVIGARDTTPDEAPQAGAPAEYPSLGDLGGYMLDLLFLDNLQSDIERLCRINETLSLLPAAKRKETTLRPIDMLMIEPSKDMREIAGRHAHHVPRSIRMLMRGVGAWDHGWRLASYLLFEPPYVNELIELGRADAMERRDEITALIGAGS